MLETMTRGFTAARERLTAVFKEVQPQMPTRPEQKTKGKKKREQKKKKM